MAFKGQGMSGPLTEKGVRPALVIVDGVTFGPRRIAYKGKPTPAMLAAPNLALYTCMCKPYPRSQMDRDTAAPAQDAPKRGGPAPKRGPRMMEMLEREGNWPDEEERKLDAFIEAKLADPQKVGVALLVAQGVPQDKARQQVMKGNMKGGIPDVSQLLAAGKSA